MATKTKKSEETRERLLKIASDHFAAHGFRQARVSDICQDAEANQAAVSYHFGGKYELYVTSLYYAMELASKKFPLPSDHSLPTEERLREFLNTVCRRIFDESEGSLFPRMFVKEIAEPTEALETILRELISKERNTLMNIVRDSLGPSATEEDVMLAHLSIVSLFQFFNFSRSIRQLVAKTKRRQPPDIDTTIDHTVNFALAGLAQKQSEIASRA